MGIRELINTTAFENEEYGIAVKKGNKEVLEKINSSVQKMLDEGSIAEWATEYSDADSEE